MYEEEYLSGNRILTPEASQLERGIFSLGIQPEFLSELDVREARIVLTGMAKIVATLAHPDRNNKTDTVAGLDVGSANALGTLFKTTTDGALQKVLDGLSGDSSLKAEQQLRIELARDHSLLASRAEELVLQMLEPQSLLMDFTGHIPIWAQDRSDEQVIARTILGLELQNGEVANGQVFDSKALLVSKLDPKAREFAGDNYSTEDPDKLFWVDDELSDSSGLPIGWCRLTYATSKSNPKKKAPAIYLYEASEAQNHNQLDGARLFGTYHTNYAEELPESEKTLAARVNDEILTRDHTKLAISGLAKLVMNRRIKPFTKDDDKIPLEHLVFYKPAASESKPASGFITNPPISYVNL